MRRALTVVGLAIVGLLPLLFWNAFAGDAQVHLVFMESASQGRFFEFNPGERVSGETSPGYMLLGAALFRLMPAAAVPVALKLVGLTAWYALCWLVYRTAVRTFGRGAEGGRAWPALTAAAAATLVGSAYNANVGMENGLFAAVVWLWFDLVQRWRWFERTPAPRTNQLALAILLGLAAWLRPEAFVLIAVAYAFKIWQSRSFSSADALGAIVACGIGAAAIAFERAYTGDVVATSILSRRVVSAPHMLGLGPVAFNPTFAIRLLFYFPLTALFVFDARSRRTGSPPESFMAAVLATFFVLYTLGGAGHLARYLIFLMPALVIGAALGARTIWRQPRRRWLVVAAAVSLAAADVTEASQRLRQYHPRQLAAAIAAPAARTQATDTLLRDLAADGRGTISVALEGVQLRYELDGRVVIRSLDGRVDRKLLEYFHDGNVDHLGYLREQRVDYLLQTPSYARDRSTWTLRVLRDLRPGERIVARGIAFRRVASGAGYAIE